MFRNGKSKLVQIYSFSLRVGAVLCWFFIEV